MSCAKKNISFCRIDFSSCRIDFSSRRIDFSSRKIDFSSRRIDFSSRKIDFSSRRIVLIIYYLHRDKVLVQRDDERAAPFETRRDVAGRFGI